MIKLRKAPAVNKKALWVYLNAEEAKELVGFTPILDKKEREAFEAEHPECRIFSHKLLGKFALLNNVANRPFNLNRSEKLAEKMVRGTFAGLWNSGSDTDNGESWIFSESDNIISCAHRLVGLIIAQSRIDQLYVTDPEFVSDHSIPEILELEILLVEGIHDPAADTVDTGDRRQNKDVLFRHGEVLKELTVTDRAALSGHLQKAIRMVKVRLEGFTDQTARGKLENEDAVAFLEEHPLIETALVWLFNENGKEAREKGGQRLVRHHTGTTLGVFAGCFYLAYLSTFERGEYEAGSYDLMKTDNDRWDAVEAFFMDIRKLNDEGEGGIRKADSPIVSAFIAALEENNSLEEKWGRDKIQSLIAKAFLSFQDRTKGKLKTHRSFKNDMNNLTRFNTFIDDGLGLDLDLTTLKANEWITQQPKTNRVSSGDFLVGDQVWVYFGHDMEPFKLFGTIEEFSLDGEKVQLAGIGEDGEEYIIEATVDQLRKDEPERPQTGNTDRLSINDVVLVTEEGYDEPWEGVIWWFSDCGDMAAVGLPGYEDNGPEGVEYSLKQLKIAPPKPTNEQLTAEIGNGAEKKQVAGTAEKKTAKKGTTATSPKKKAATKKKGVKKAVIV